MSKPLAIVMGFIGKLPVAGMSFYNLHYIAGLHALGYDVHYIERQNKPDEYYNPDTNAMTDQPSYALDYLKYLLPRSGITEGHFSLIDREQNCHGSDWSSLRDALNCADFLLTLCDPAWFDELERCSRRAFVDGDPLFTQAQMINGQTIKANALEHYDTLFTYGTRMGAADCTIPAVGRQWIPTRPVVATKLWDATPPPNSAPVTALLHWAAGSDVNYNGRIYGHKNREFERFIELPKRSRQPFALAVGGDAPRARLRENGWNLVNPLDATRTIEAYQGFIVGSRADFGIAKHAYVASRSGWFSDRSTCYLAAGRPVLHQDTGCGDWLPTGEGVFLFSDVEDVLEALNRLDADYDRHAQAARRIAEEHFEAATVIGHMLDEAGFR